MDNRLRPMNLGEILDSTAALYRTHFLLFTGISSIFAAAMLAVDLLYLRSIVLLGYPNLTAHWRWNTAAAAVAEALVVLLLAGLSIVAINRAVAWVYLDQPATIRAAAKSVLPKVRRYLWLMTVVAFRAWAPLAALYVAFFAIVLSTMPHGFLNHPSTAPQVSQDPSAMIAAGLGMVVLAPLMLLATVYGVWMSLRYSLAIPSCVVEDLTAMQAIRRSIKLSEGSRGRIFVLGLLVYAVRLMLGLLFGFPIIFLAVKHLGRPLPIGWMVFQQLGAFFTNALIGPIYAIGLTLFYYDQRIRKEGYDIEWMMQAAGHLAQQTNSGPAASPLI
jgi:hypothetical protein